MLLHSLLDMVMAITIRRQEEEQTRMAIRIGVCDNMTSIWKYVLFSIMCLLVIAVLFVRAEIRKAYQIFRTSVAYHTYYSEGYYSGYKDGERHSVYDPVNACNDRYAYDENGEYYEAMYSRLKIEYAASYAAGYGAGYTDGINGSSCHEDEWTSWKGPYYNPFFLRLALTLNIK